MQNCINKDIAIDNALVHDDLVGQFKKKTLNFKGHSTLKRFLLDQMEGAHQINPFIFTNSLSLSCLLSLVA